MIDQQEKNQKQQYNIDSGDRIDHGKVILLDSLFSL